MRVTLTVVGVEWIQLVEAAILLCAKPIELKDLSPIRTRPAQLMYAHPPSTMPVWALRHQSHHHLWRPLVRALGETLGRER